MPAGILWASDCTHFGISSRWCASCICRSQPHSSSHEEDTHKNWHLIPKHIKFEPQVFAVRPAGPLCILDGGTDTVGMVGQCGGRNVV